MKILGFYNNIIKTRFILSNHKLYNSPDKLLRIMNDLELKPAEMDLSCESWWVNNNWWENNAFIQALYECQVDIRKTIVIKLSREAEKEHQVSLENHHMAIFIAQLVLHP